MAKDIIDIFLERVAREARELGAIVRCEDYGVLAIVHPRHATEEEKQPGLSLPVEDRQQGRQGGQGSGQGTQQ